MRPLNAVLLSLLLSLAAAAQPFDTKAVDKIVTSTMRAWGIPGAAVAIVKNDRVVYVSGYGTKELGGTEPVTAGTLFQIASTSKAGCRFPHRSRAKGASLRAHCPAVRWRPRSISVLTTDSPTLTTRSTCGSTNTARIPRDRSGSCTGPTPAWNPIPASGRPS